MLMPRLLSRMTTAESNVANVLHRRSNADRRRAAAKNQTRNRSTFLQHLAPAIGARASRLPPARRPRPQARYLVIVTLREAETSSASLVLGTRTLFRTSSPLTGDMVAAQLASPPVGTVDDMEVAQDDSVTMQHQHQDARPIAHADRPLAPLRQALHQRRALPGLVRVKIGIETRCPLVDKARRLVDWSLPR